MTVRDSSDSIMRYFEYEYLQTAKLREISELIYDAAEYIDSKAESSEEKTAGLRKLLEARDCFTRALT